MASDRSMCPGADSASKSVYQDIPGAKGSRCVRLTTYHLHVLIVKKSGGLNLLEPCGLVQACNGMALLLYIYIYMYIYIYILIIKPTRCTISQIYFDKGLCMFRTDLLPIIRSLYTVYAAIGICHAVV